MQAGLCWFVLPITMTPRLPQVYEALSTAQPLPMVTDQTHNGTFWESTRQINNGSCSPSHAQVTRSSKHGMEGSLIQHGSSHSRASLQEWPLDMQVGPVAHPARR